MIDTIAVVLPCDKEMRSAIRKLSTTTLKHDNPRDVVLFSSDLYNIQLPSWDYHTNIFMSDKYPDTLKIEFSVPKFVFGHNLFMIYPQEIKDTMEEFRQFVSNKLNYELPILTRWEIVRLDLCYSWRYLSQDQASAILTSLSLYKHPRKTQNIYPGESINQKGSEYTTKFYLKSPEFFAHDFKHILKQNVDDAYRLLNIADGILRWEVSLKSRAVRRYFDTQKVTIDDIVDYDRIAIIMNQILNKSLRGVTQSSMTTFEAFERLNQVYKPVRALHIWKYYLLSRHTDFSVREICLKSVNPSTNYRLNIALKKAGIGVKSDSDTADFDILIPSKFAINPNPIPRSGSGGVRT